MWKAKIVVGAARAGWQFDEAGTAVLAEYQSEIAAAGAGRVVVTLTLPAQSLAQACTTALAVVQLAAGRPGVSVEVMAEDDAEARAGVPPIPPLVSVSEAAEMLGVSRQAVLQSIDRGTLQAERVGSTWALARVAIEQLL